MSPAHQPCLPLGEALQGAEMMGTLPCCPPGAHSMGAQALPRGTVSQGGREAEGQGPGVAEQVLVKGDGKQGPGLPRVVQRKKIPSPWSPWGMWLEVVT